MHLWFIYFIVSGLSFLINQKLYSIFILYFSQVLNMQLSDGGQGDVPVDENKLHGKPDKTLRFSLCSDNLEGISEGEGLLHSGSV